MKLRLGLLALLALVLATHAARADTFGTGVNEFTLNFVPISGATNPTSGYGIVNDNYRMGKFEITNDQWDKFKGNLAPVAVMGNPSSAYDNSFYNWGTGATNVPTNSVSWYEAAQFVNWLNTSTGHQAAYKFTGTQGTGDYTLAAWSAAEAAGGTNLYRHKDAYYFLPTEDEWVKAAYWNGAALQAYATKAGESLFQGNGTNGGWNYYDGDSGPDGPLIGPWDFGSGSQELNGTYDMMGNVWEWMESPYSDTNYGTGSSRGLRGGSFFNTSNDLAASYRGDGPPTYEGYSNGFRVASVPEPGCITLLVAGLAALTCWRRWR